MEQKRTLSVDTSAPTRSRRDSFVSRLSSAVRKGSISAPNSPSIFSSSTSSLFSALPASDAENVSFSLDVADYLIHQPIGYGSSAVVYLATYKPLKKQVAIKMLDLDMYERNQIEDLRRELQIMTLSKHPNLMQIHGAFVQQSKLYIVMPYMSVGSCLDVLRSGHAEGLEETLIATILKQALLGLEYLHKNGHIHRDVKAGNLVVDDDGTVQLADFGVSSSLMEGGDRKTARRTFVGTPCWMAPEVLAPENGYDYKADIWSFGITAMELATGHAPYAKFPPLKVLMLTLSRDPPTLNRGTCKHKYSKCFKEMIDSCLQKDPTLRPSAEKLLQHSFFKQSKKSEYLVRNLLQDLPPVSTRPVRKPPITRPKSAEIPVIWDFTSSDGVSIGDSSDTNVDMNSIDEDKMERPVRRRTIGASVSVPVRRGRFHVHTGSLDLGSPIPSMDPPPFITTRNPDVSDGIASRKGRFDLLHVDDVKRKQRARVRFASTSSDTSSNTVIKMGSKVQTHIESLIISGEQRLIQLEELAATIESGSTDTTPATSPVIDTRRMSFMSQQSDSTLPKPCFPTYDELMRENDRLRSENAALLSAMRTPSKL